ncbi:MAG: transposase [Myxococcales bacterium]|nr:transposase [Myxococcales bacterium]
MLGAEHPPRLFPRSLCHTSVYAWLAVEKFALGVSCYRLEQSLETEEESLDRGTMCRYLEELGATLGATVVEAMFADARDNCHVLSTDATGAAIQPEPSADGRRQTCKKGHFFTIVADCDHVLFHYTDSHSSDAVKSLFKGFSGHLQCDASPVCDILDRGVPTLLPEADDDERLSLVGCWAHCHRYFFEAAITKHRSAIEGLKKIREMFRVDAQFAKLQPRDRKRRRATELAPLIDDFFRWVEQARRTEVGRTRATKAPGYAHNQEQELRRVLEDGKLALDNGARARAVGGLWGAARQGRCAHAYVIEQYGKFRSEAVVLLMADMAAKSQTKRNASAWLVEHREFAEPVLAEAARGKSGVAPSAEKALKALSKSK